MGDEEMICLCSVLREFGSRAHLGGCQLVAVAWKLDLRLTPAKGAESMDGSFFSLHSSIEPKDGAERTLYEQGNF